MLHLKMFNWFTDFFKSIFNWFRPEPVIHQWEGGCVIKED